MKMIGMLRRTKNQVGRQARRLRPAGEDLEPICLLSGLPSVASVTRSTDADGNVLIKGLSATGRLAFLVEDFTNGNVLAMLADNNGNITGIGFELRDSQGDKFFFEYDSHWTLMRFEEDQPSGKVLTASYNQGRLLAYTITTYDSGGDRLTTRYDSSGNKTLFEETSPNHNVLTISYENGSVEEYAFSTTDSSGNRFAYVMDSGGDLLFSREIHANGLVTVTTYDGFGDVTGSSKAVTDSAGNRYIVLYDSQGNLTEAAEQYASGPIVSIGFSNGVSTGYSYTTFDSTGNAFTTYHTATGSLRGSTRTTTDPFGDILLYSFDANGNQVGFTEYYLDGSTSGSPNPNGVQVRQAGSFLDGLLGPGLANIVEPFAFPLSYGIDGFDFNSLVQADYSSLLTFDSYLPASSFGFNYGAALGAITPIDLYDAAFNDFYVDQDYSGYRLF